jgi:hypothetical protein
VPHAKPASPPEGLVVKVMRAKALPGAGAEAAQWLAVPDEQVEECMATLDRDQMAIEIVFRLREGQDDSCSASP